MKGEGGVVCRNARRMQGLQNERIRFVTDELLCRLRVHECSG